MKKNMGTIDKGIRLVLALLFVVLNLTHVITGVLGIVLLVLAIVFAVTSFIGFCPLYLPFGLNSVAKEE